MVTGNCLCGETADTESLSMLTSEFYGGHSTWINGSKLCYAQELGSIQVCLEFYELEH